MEFMKSDLKKANRYASKKLGKTVQAGEGGIEVINEDWLKLTLTMFSNDFETVEGDVIILTMVKDRRRSFVKEFVERW